MATIESIVKESVKKPSPRFGPLVMEVDHEIIGKKMKDFRKLKRVMAVDVAKKLKISKTLVNFLETGRRLWSLETMKDYTRAVRDAKKERPGQQVERIKTKK